MSRARSAVEAAKGDGSERSLRAVLDLVRTPHEYDDGREGSTLSLGLDALQGWCKDAQPISADAWQLLQARLVDALGVSHTSTVNRARRILADVLRVWDASDRAVDLPKNLAAHASKYPDAQASLVLLEVLVAHYGTHIVGSDACAFFASLLAAMQAGRGSVSRRSRLAMAFVLACRNENQNRDVWLPPLAASLVHPDERGAENVVAHLVHPLLDACPDVLGDLLSALGGTSEKHVRALLAVLRAAKMRDLCTLVDDADADPQATPMRVPCSLLHACIASASPRIQVAALALTVEAKTPAALFCAAELDVVRAFFAASLMLPSAVARKDSIALFVKLLVRMRVGMHALAKKDKASPLLDAMHTLLRALFHAVLQAMHPGAPYACTVLGVSLLFLLLEASLTLPAPGEELHGFALQDAVRALHKAKTTYPGHAPFPGVAPSAALSERLLYLASESTYDDIQQTATLLLVRLAPVPEAELRTPTFVGTHIVAPSLERMGALKDSDAYAAVQLLQLYHIICAEDAAAQDEALARVYAAVGEIGEGGRSDTDAPWPLHLLRAHTALLNARLAYAEQHGVGAASHAQALHGTMAAVHLLAQRTSADGLAAEREVLGHCVRRAWALTSPVLCAAAPEGGAEDDDDNPLPELAHAMHIAQTDALDTPAYQRILSYAWRTMKEAAALHATVMRASPDTQQGSDLFLEWMLHIRHRGAFSTIYPQYEGVAKDLLRTSDSPTAWLQQLLARLDEQCEQFSTTRRSAGVGYAVLALLSAHAGKKAALVLEATIAQLVRMSQSEQPVRTIHALNILRVMVMDSTLAPSMRAHLGTALSRAVSCFCSPHWGVRNASMMLFSAISTRYFGIHALAQGSASKPLDGLLEASPALGAALVDTLRSESQRLGAADLAAVGHGSALYAVLLLLGTLQDGAAHGLPMDEVRSAVERCTHSANWKIREQAASCFCALLPTDEKTNVAGRILQDASLHDQNALHGQLVVLQKLGGDIPLMERIDLLEKNACPATCAAYLDVVQRWQGDWTPVATWIAALLGEATGPVEKLRADPFLSWLLPTVLSLGMQSATACLPPPPALFQDVDRATALLRVLHERNEQGTLATTLSALGWDATALQGNLLGLALDENAALDCRIGAAELAETLSSTASCDWAAQAEALLICVLCTEHTGVRDALLPLLGVAACYAPAEYVDQCVTVWELCADDSFSVESRLGTAHAVQKVYDHLAQNSDALFRAHRIVLRLLHDDSGDVRDVACAMLSTAAALPIGHACLASFAPAIEAMRVGDVQCTEYLWSTLCDTAPERFSRDAWSLLSQGTLLY